MLPGLRFLFVAIIFSLSLMIFGLGAAALFRSAHEEFVSLPNRRAQPETTFAQSNAPATLAMLRVDTPVTERSATSGAADPDPSNMAPPSEPFAKTEADKPAAVQERIAALTDVVPDAVKSASSAPTVATSTSTEPTTSTASTTSTEAPVQAAPPPEMQASLETEKPEIKAPEPKPEVTAVEKPDPTPPETAEVVDTAPIVAPPPMDGSARAAALKVATLGGPEVVVDPRPKASKGNASTKRAHHRKRRKIVARPRVVSPKPDTFGLFDPQPTQPQPPPIAAKLRRSAQAGPVATGGP